VLAVVRGVRKHPKATTRAHLWFRFAKPCGQGAPPPGTPAPRFACRCPPILAPQGGCGAGGDMALYSVHLKSVSRGKGHSASAAAAYRAGLVLDDPNTG